MDKSIEFEGWFFLPSDTSVRVPGIVTYNPSNSIKLRLLGSWPGVRFGDFSSEVIWGDIDNGKAITLYKPIEIRRDNALSSIYSRSTFVAEIMIIGGFFDNKRDLNFNRIAVYFEYLSEWFFSHHMINFDQVVNTSKIILTSERLPKQFISLSKNYELSINTFRTVPDINYYYTQARIQLESYIMFKSSKRKNLQQFLQDVFHFQYFLTVCTQRYCDINRVEGVFKITNKREFVSAKIYFIAPRFSSRYKSISGPENLLLPFNKIESSFDAIIKTWFIHKNALEKCLDSFLSIYKEPNVYNPGKFLFLVKSMESFHRELRHPGRMNQIDRYMHLFEEARPAFNPFLKIRSKRNFCKKLTALRNEFVHNLNMPNSLFYRNRDLYRITEELKIIFSCVLLKEIGLSLPQIKTLVTQNSFGEI